MPNTKSAERRTRNSERKRLRNRSVKSRLRKFEKSYLEAVASGKKEEATKNLQALTSALDKACKTGVLPKSTVSRKKSRMAVRLNKAPKAQ